MKILLILFLSTFSFALSKIDIYKLFKDKNYKQVCIKGNSITSKYLKDDTFLSVVALSCVKSDMLNTALRISKFMRNSKLARNNASYIANLYLIKKLLIQFMYDKIDLSNLSLPKSNHFLSIIFENLSSKNYKKKGDKIIIDLKDKTYILTPINENNKHKISILIVDKKTHKQYEHIFW